MRGSVDLEIGMPRCWGSVMTESMSQLGVPADVYTFHSVMFIAPLYSISYFGCRSRSLCLYHEVSRGVKLVCWVNCPFW